MANIWIALGSNLENPVKQLIEARRILSAALIEISASSLYKSPPFGYANQPEFINAVIQYQTNKNPYEVLDFLLAVELERGRKREFKNSPRTLDLDLLHYENVINQEERLILPHPRMLERNFVMQPLAEISPDLRLPFCDQNVLEISKKLSALEIVCTKWVA